MRAKLKRQVMSSGGYKALLSKNWCMLLPEETSKGVQLVLGSYKVRTRLQILEVDKIMEENSVKSFFLPSSEEEL